MYIQCDGLKVVQLSVAELVRFLAYISLCSQAHAYYDNFSVFTFFLGVPFISFYTLRNISPFFLLSLLKRMLILLVAF